MSLNLRSASLFALLAAAAVSQAAFLDDFGVSDPGVALTQTGTGTGNPIALGGGLTRQIAVVQNTNAVPGSGESSALVSNGAFSFSNSPLVQGDYTLDYTYATPTSLAGTTAFRVDVQFTDLPYELSAVVTDTSNRQTTFLGAVPSVAGNGLLVPAFLFPTGGNADLTNVARITFTSTNALASVDSTIDRIEAVPEPASVAAFGLGVAGLLRRRRRA